MESKIKTLKMILSIGAVILLIAGISFQFVSTIEDYVRVITMLLISGVFVFLSFYEEKYLEYKGGSILTYIFANVGIVVTYISCSIQELFGSWFSPNGDGAFIFLGVLLFLIALLVAVATVKYKLYKMIELSLWLAVFGIAFILRHFEMSYLWIIVILLGTLLINNIFRMTIYSKWFTIGLSILHMFAMDVDVLLSSALLIVIVSNMVLIMFKNDKIRLLPMIVASLAFIDYSLILELGLVGLIGLSLLDITIAYFKLIDTPTKGIFYKIIINLAYLPLLVNIFTEVDKYIIPCIVILTSLALIYLCKDSREDYVLPIKAFYFTAVELSYLPIESFKSYIIVFAVNIVILLLYFLAKKKSVRYENLVLLIILNIYTIGLSLDECIPSIIYLILFALDFYIIYVKEDKVLPMTIAFGVYGFFSMVKLIAGIDSIYYLVAALVYLVYLLITRKNKVIFGISLGLFIANLAYYTFEVIPNEIVSGLIFELLIAMGIVLFQHECLTKPADKLVFIAVTTGIQIGFTILLPVNILLKIFALVEAIVLIAVSMIDDEYKSLYEEGLIGVVISLIFIIGTIDNLPKSLYLIIVGLVIIVTVPIVIKRYIKRYEIEKALAKNKPKEEVQVTQESKKIEFTSNGKKIEYHNNFCGACGTKVFDAYDFCPTCGNKLK